MEQSHEKRRQCDLNWIREIRDQCQKSGTPFFLKQTIQNGRVDKSSAVDGALWRQFPADGSGIETRSGNGEVGRGPTEAAPFSLSHFGETEKVRTGMTDADHYAALMRQIKIVKDRVRGVVHRKSNGLYLYGRAGTSKTHTVCTTLDTLGVNYAYSNGHLTPIGLFELIAENRDRVIVMDDVTAIFNQPIAVQILLAALGNRHDDTGVRYVRHKTARGDRIVAFAGGIIGISNLSLSGQNNEVLRALNDRIFSINYDPSDDQIIALMMALARRGLRGVSPDECVMVCNFLLNAMRTREIPAFHSSLRRQGDAGTTSCGR